MGVRLSNLALAVNQVGSSTAQEQDNYISGTTPAVMTKIFEPNINLAVLERDLSEDVASYAQALIKSQSTLNLRYALNPEASIPSLQSSLPDLIGRSAFVEDVALLMEMYAYLFELDEVGLRLQILDRPMCPRLHVDRLGCRLISTYWGVGTQWLRNSDVDRTKLGTGNKGLSDEQSGIMTRPNGIQNISQGDVALLKGEGWFDNEGLGIVHRSPAVPQGEKRIVVTMDFA